MDSNMKEEAGDVQQQQLSVAEKEDEDLKKRVEAIFKDSDTEAEDEDDDKVNVIVNATVKVEEKEERNEDVKIDEVEDIEFEVRKKVDELTAEIDRVSLEETKLNESEKIEQPTVESKEEKIDNDNQIKITIPAVTLTEDKATKAKSPTPPPIAPKPVIKVKPMVVYPDDLNPFGEEEEEEEKKKVQTSMAQPASTKKIYPTDLNPFGEEEEEEEVIGTTTTSQTYSKSLNPFGSDDEDEDETVVQSALRVTPVPRPRTSRQSTPTPPTAAPQPSRLTPVPKVSVRSKKKRPAPQPPGMNTSIVSDLDRSITSFGGDDQSIDSLSSAASSRTPTPLPRRSKPGAGETPNGQSPLPTSRQGTPDSSSIANESTLSARVAATKNKKRPAPSQPVMRRVLKSSVAEIEAELNEIGDQLPLLEAKRNELELWLSNNQLPAASGQEETVGEELAALKAKRQEKINEFVDFAQQFCKLAKKQKELMYMKREHKLVETYSDLDYEVRIIHSKQDSQKTKEDVQKYEDLMAQMLEIVRERNEIVENMTEDENKEIENYQKLIARVLPETATGNGHDAISTSGSEGGKNAKHHGLKLHLPKTLLGMKKKKSKKPNSENEIASNDGGEVQGIALRNGKEDGEDGEVVGVGEEEKKKKKKHFTISRSTLKKLTSPISGSSKSKLDIGHDNSSNEPGK